MVMHEDEYEILKQILWKVLGDDECFAMVVPGEQSDARRAEDRLVLARFLERMERQFALRAEERATNGASEPHGQRLVPPPQAARSAESSASSASVSRAQ